MPLHDLNIGESLGLRRGDAAVCVPVYGAEELFAQCLAAVLAHTEPDVPIVVCDDATPSQRVRPIIEEALSGSDVQRIVYYLRQPQNVGFVVNVNGAMTAAAPADVVLLNSDCFVTEGWFASLRAAAYSDSRVATATALTNAGTIVSVPDRNRPVLQLREGAKVELMAAAVRSESLHLCPDLPTCIGHCVYIRRSAIELVGPFDERFSPGYEEEVDFSQRCILHGLRNVVADDLFVFHHQAASFGGNGAAVQRRHDHHAIIVDRYPYFDAWVRQVSEQASSPLARSLSAASTALRGTSVAIDGRCLTQAFTGTQLVTLGVIAALHAHTRFHLRVLVPDNLGPEAERFLSARPEIRLIRHQDPIRPEDPNNRLEPADIAHRPYQVTSPADLGVLRQMGYRLIITQLDNIALRNPGYFQDFAQWNEYRELTYGALAAADQVVFISRHGANDARELGLVSDEQVNVVYPALDHELLGIDIPARPPSGAERIGGWPFLLCLGTDFLHKNRVFAIRLLEALADAHAFDGMLVFAGPKVAAGSSAEEEDAYLREHPALRDRVLDVGAVDEAGKLWLLEQAAAVVYPSTYEGFGLTPFEAADANTPCLFAWHTSLSELLPQSSARLVPWDERESARRAASVLRPGWERDQLVRAIRLAGARFTSRSSAQGLTEAYTKALRSSVAGATTLPSAELQELRAERDMLRRELSSIYDDPLNRGLAGRYAVLPPELRRPVLAVATRPALRKTAIGLYRAGHALRNRRGRRLGARNGDAQ
jgi:GT2 family glycosyltransferase/glycosyltransferase involved in cell wall biosynthesis